MSLHRDNSLITLKFMSASCGNPLDDDFIVVEIFMFSVNTVFSGHHLRTRTESSHRWLHRRTHDSCLPTSVRRSTFHEDSKFFRLNETIIESLTLFKFTTRCEKWPFMCSDYYTDFLEYGQIYTYLLDHHIQDFLTWLQYVNLVEISLSK